MITATTTNLWITCEDTCATLGIGRKAVERLANDRRIGSRQLPGLPRRYFRPDVERLAEACTTMAVEPQGS